jgi:hypothetical protein
MAGLSSFPVAPMLSSSGSAELLGVDCTISLSHRHRHQSALFNPIAFKEILDYGIIKYFLEISRASYQLWPSLSLSDECLTFLKKKQKMQKHAFWQSPS